MTKLVIELTNSSDVCIVDEADAELVAGYRWRLMNTGYVSTGYMKNGYDTFMLLHRHLLGLGKGRVPEVDHIDRDKLNNRRNNLRIASRAENIQNTGNYARLHKLPKGVYVSGAKYRAMVRHEGVLQSLGSFDTIEAAKAVRDAWCAQHWD
jgi:hypothetical protein